VVGVTENFSSISHTVSLSLCFSFLPFFLLISMCFSSSFFFSTLNTPILVRVAQSA